MGRDGGHTGMVVLRGHSCDKVHRAATGDYIGPFHVSFQVIIASAVNETHRILEAMGIMGSHLALMATATDKTGPTTELFHHNLKSGAVL